MINYQNDNQKRKKMITFIKATQKLIDTEGLSAVSIRKIANLSGFHNSTIYLYFKDLDELVMLASIQHFQQYRIQLEKQLHLFEDPYKNFFMIWESFADSAFQTPDIFYNFFFGKYSQNLFSFLNVYYDLFPEEKMLGGADYNTLYFGHNYKERCHYILKPLIDDPRTCVTRQNISLITEIIVSISKDFLNKKDTDTTLDNQMLLQKLIQMLHFLIDKNVPV